MLKDYFLLTLKSIRYRPLRSWLTIIGIVIGIMLVVVIISLSNGVSAAINGQLQMLGNDLLIILPGKETAILTGFVGGQKFNYNDIIDLERIPGVAMAMPVDAGTVNAEFDGEKKAVFVHASRLDYLQAIFEKSEGLQMYQGAWPTDPQSSDVILGYLAGTSLFKNKVQVGDEVIIQSKRLRVAGILARSGNQTDDNSFYMSWDLFHAISGVTPGAMSAIVQVAPGANVDLVALQVRYQLEKQQEVKDFTILTPEKTTQIVGTILGIIELALLVISLVSLLVGAVGIMNTMYTSVVERTRQIGIMKAVGATSDAILSLFLVESGLIGLVGGVLGILLGLAIASGIGAMAASFGVSGLFSFAAIDYGELGIILLVTFVTGVLSGILPARQAAKMEPAEALRYE